MLRQRYKLFRKNKDKIYEIDRMCEKIYFCALLKWPRFVSIQQTPSGASKHLRGCIYLYNIVSLTPPPFRLSQPLLGSPQFHRATGSERARRRSMVCCATLRNGIAPHDCAPRSSLHFREILGRHP